MTNIKKISLTGLFCAALSTICMDVEPEVPKIQVLDDGHEWASIKTIGHLAPLLKKVVACRSEALDQNDHELYKMDASNPTRYGFISFYRRPWCDNYDLRILCTDPQARDWPLTNHHLGSTHSFMRLLTLDEMRRMSEDAQRNTLHFHQLCDFTLDNLIPQDRIKYFRMQAGKQAWQWQRLLLLGHKDHGSSLRLLPKDLISMLTRYAVNAQACHLLEQAQDGMVLDLSE